MFKLNRLHPLEGNINTLSFIHHSLTLKWYNVQFSLRKQTFLVVTATYFKRLLFIMTKDK